MHPLEVTASSILKNKKISSPQGPSMRVITKFHKVIAKKKNHKDYLRTNIIPQSLYNSFQFSLQKQSQCKPYSIFRSHMQKLKTKNAYILSTYLYSLKISRKNKSLPVLSAEFTEIHTCRSA